MDDDLEQMIGGGSTHSIPPYIPFQTFLTFLKQLKTDGLPPQIDKSVLAKFSGGTQGQLKVALKAMGLMDENQPTQDLDALVNAYETDAFNPMLKTLLERTYPYVFAIDLTTATPTMFADAFKVTGAKEDVSRKCRTFFLHAAKAAGVPLGNRLLTGSVPRASNGGTRKRKKAVAAVKENEGVGNGGQQNRLPSSGGIASELLKKFPDFDPAWPDEIKAKWFAGFDQFMKGAMNKGD